MDTFADAIISVSAMHQQAVLVTSDNHFEGLHAVEYFKKQDEQYKDDNRYIEAFVDRGVFWRV